MLKLSNATRCKALREVALVKKSMRRPPLKQQLKDRRIEWAGKYTKTDFSSVIFTDECRVTLDGQMAEPEDGSSSTILLWYEHVNNKEEEGYVLGCYSW